VIIDESLRGQLTELNQIILENTRENIDMYEIGYNVINLTQNDREISTIVFANSCLAIFV
jgi:hypothetical protein